MRHLTDREAARVALQRAPDDETALRGHVAECASCAARVASVEELGRLAAPLGAVGELSEEFTKRLLEELARLPEPEGARIEGADEVAEEERDRSADRCDDPDAAGGPLASFLESLWRLRREARAEGAAISDLAAEDVGAALAALDGLPEVLRGPAAVAACRSGAALVHRKPEIALAFARAISERAAELPDEAALPASDAPAEWTSAEEVRCEAALLESQALLEMGRAEEAYALASYASEATTAMPIPGLYEGRAAYFAGSALSFLGRPVEAFRRLRLARALFRVLGDRNWEGKALSALALLLSMRGKCRWAVRLFDRALTRLDGVESPSAFAVALLYKADAQARLKEFDAAAVNYQTSLVIVEQNDLTVPRVVIHLGLGELDYLQGKYSEATDRFRFAVSAARALGLYQITESALLYLAECLQRVGRLDSAREALASFRNSRLTRGAPREPALSELDELERRGDVAAAVIRRIREQLYA